MTNADPVFRFDQIDSAIEARVDALLAQMTLPEKIGQLVQVTAFAPLSDEEMLKRIKQAQEESLPFYSIFPLKETLTDQVRDGTIGSLLNIADAALVNRLQRIAVEESRLGIPLIIGSDIIHGFRTIFPIPLAEACTWNPDLLEQAARAAADEASTAGIDWIFAPMIDIGRDPRWGRVAEGTGEDTFLAMAMARARVRGFQSTTLQSGRRVAACPKHYVAYGAAEAGRDYNTVDLSERTLRDVYLPPFKAAFEAGAGSVMSSFNEIGGIPVTANAHVLRTILRDEWQWPGVVLSDYEAVRELIPHGVATDLADAARQSILAGLDMDMVSDGYARHLEAHVSTGSVPLALIDQAVRRVLRLKLQLGLFDHPYVDEGLGAQVILREEYRALALEVAQQSMVLLKNQDDILPLTPGAQRVALIGPLADAARDMLGTWVLFGQAEDAETIRAGVDAYLGAGAYEHVPGVPTIGSEGADIAAAVAAAQSADIVVVVLGEGANMSGEARSRAQLGLPGQQQALLDALAATGKPIVAVLVCGRPLAIPRMTDQVSALLVAWHGGIRAGRAVADLLFGTATPSGRLTASWPRSEGQLPLYYAHKNTGRPMEGEGVTQFMEPFKSRYIDMPNEPLFPFGYGLSYTSVEYRDLQIETPTLSIDGTLAVSATIVNRGARAATEVAQLYVRDLVGSVTRPVRELKGFQRITLQPGETRRVHFELPVGQLAFCGRDMQTRVEPGQFRIWVGPHAAAGLEGQFEVLG